MRRTVQERWDDAVIIICVAMACGSVMCAGALVGFSSIHFNSAGGTVLIPLGIIVGGMLGLVSVSYILPLLMDTDIRRSLPLLVVVTVPVGILTGLWHPFVGAGSALLAGVICCVYANKTLGRTVDPRFCLKCRYEFGRIIAATCPECGAPAEHRPSWVRGFCKACQRTTDLVEGTCCECGGLEADGYFTEVERKRERFPR